MIKYGIDLTAKYITKYVWGDVYDYIKTYDFERKTHIIIHNISINPYTKKVNVLYKFVYEGNKEPNAIFCNTLTEFKNSCKIIKNEYRTII